MGLLLGRIFTRCIFIGLLFGSLTAAQAKSNVSLYENTVILDEKPLRIAVASNFAPTLKKLLARNNPDQIKFPHPLIIPASSGTLFLQIKHGAAFDLFLSADRERPALLTEANLALIGSQQTYAYGQLALWSATHEIATDPFTALKNNKQRLAIANPRIAPYGKAAKQVLENLQLWGDYKSRLIKGINIGQTFQQTRSQAVNSGIVSNSQLILNNLKGVIIPARLHQPIEQQLVILKKSQHIQQAQRFVKFLMSEQSQQFITDSGYTKLSDVKGEVNTHE